MSTVTVTGTERTADGEPIRRATFKIELVTGSSGLAFNAGSDEIIRYVAVTTDNSGVWSVLLTPNSEINPAGTYYRRALNTKAGVAQALFSVPATPGTYQLESLLLEDPDAPDAVIIGGVASNVVFTPAGGIAATNAQAAIVEAKTDAITAAAADATTKADAAQAAAATDATTKVAAEASARATAVSAEATARNTAISTAIANLVAGAPGALDTLLELANQIGTDEAAATALASLVATKAPTASPTFTGTVTIPNGTIPWSVLSGAWVNVKDPLYGAYGDFTHDDTSAFASALTAAAAAGGGVVYAPPGNYTLSPLAIPSNVYLVGAGFGTQLSAKASSSTHLLTLADPSATVGAGVMNLSIHGNKANQSTACDGIHFTNSTASASILPKHRVHNVFVQQCKGNGVYMGQYTRESHLDTISTYKCDGYGFFFEGAADSQYSNLIAGQSGLEGFYLLSTHAVTFTNTKSWYSGQVTATSAGYLIESCTNVEMVAAYSQENGGHGFNLFGHGGAPLTGIRIQGTSDADNASGGSFYGMNLFQVTGAVVDLTVCKFPGGLGTPVNGLNLGNTVSGCDITAMVSGQSSFEVDGAGVGQNDIKVNGRHQVLAGTYAATYTPSPWQAETHAITLTGNITVANPLKTPAGLVLRFVFTQDATGGRTITWGSNFATDWSPPTTASSTAVISFICDGTKWRQFAASPDTRSTDTRTPSAASVTDAMIATTLSPSKITGTAVVTADSRLSDTRTPTDASVTTAKIAGGGLATSAITGTAVVTADSRLSDARTPTAHAASHASGGSDPLYGYQLFTSSGTWTRPTGVTKVKARVIGAGGGGAGGGSASTGIAQVGGAGGGSGGVWEGEVTVSTDLTVTINAAGSGGSGGAAGGNAGGIGGNGGTTTLTGTGVSVTANGGGNGNLPGASSTTVVGGGQHGRSAAVNFAGIPGNGGVSGSGCGPIFPGVVGGAGGGAATATNGGGGGAAATTTGATSMANPTSGASGTTSGVNGTTATIPGCGGGGGGGGTAGTGAGGTGGSGCAGSVEIWWTA